jgi:outer membrane receptor protein involved in Fe transport
MLFSGFMYAQTTVTGKVTDQAGVPIPGANIIIVGKAIGAVADFDGNFNLSTSEVTPPFQIRVSSVGFKPQTIQITTNNQSVNVQLEEEATMLGEIVLSASRTPERIFESPVSVERLGIKEIKNTASADFYDGLENLKGVDVNTNSLTFKSVNTRGFATFANTRFMQLVDGMDNSTPALNFPIGNLVGMIETDVQSVELLPGASSALYGANAFNGILFMRSKNPFDAPGISAHFKQGITSQEAAGDNSYTDFGFRAAHKFSEKFAAKVNFGYLKGTDWAANNEEDINTPGLTRANSGYDGVNVYGDEVARPMNVIGDLLVAAGQITPQQAAILPSDVISRTGYAEGDLTDYEASSVKADWGLYFRPWENDFEVSYVGKVGTGSTIYQGINRYNIDNFFQQQHKLEFKNDNFFLRGYVVADKAGDSYDMVFTGVNINRDWKDDSTWFGQYVGAYLAAIGGGASSDQAHGAGRQFADMGRFMPGTPEFESSFNKIIQNPDLTSGSKFQDASRYYHADANYNFSHLTDFADIQVGGSYRKYHLNSSGTIYTDVDGPIRYSEFGVYTQIQKKFLEEERLKLTASVRYDKSELFDGFFSPRVSLGYTAGTKKNHNIRASFQTGFRNPTTQDLYIGLDAGRGILVGSAEDNPARDVRMYGVSAFAQANLGLPATISFTGEGAYNNSFTASSAEAFAASAAAGTPNPTLLEAANPEYVQPEQVTSFEVGYRASLNKVSLDLSAYYNSYKDFISTEDVAVPFYGDVQLTQTIPTPLGPTPLAVIALGNGDWKGYQAYTNSDADVSSYGASVGLSAKVFGNFDLGANYTYAHLELGDNVPQDFNTNFNTPEHKVKATFGNTDLFKNFGFNLAWRWSDNYEWQASFGNGAVPAYHVVDAQINLRVPSLKSTFKAGATNLLGEEYFTAFGTGHIGSQYYVSWTINNL